MKRVIALTLAVAMIGMAFAGAGTVAADKHKEDPNDVDPVVVEEDDFDVTITADAELTQAQDVTQQNIANQDASVEQQAGVGGDGGDATASADAGDNSTANALAAGGAGGSGTAENVTQDASVDQSIQQDNTNVQQGESFAANILG